MDEDEVPNSVTFTMSFNPARCDQCNELLGERYYDNQRGARLCNLACAQDWADRALKPKGHDETNSDIDKALERWSWHYRKRQESGTTAFPYEAEVLAAYEAAKGKPPVMCAYCGSEKRQNWVCERCVSDSVGLVTDDPLPETSEDPAWQVDGATGNIIGNEDPPIDPERRWGKKIEETMGEED